MTDITISAHPVGSSDARANLVKVESFVRSLEQIEVPLQHFFAEGVYARQGFIKKGTIFVGRVHLHSQINIISSGDISVLTENGAIRLVGPCTWVSPPGAQRAAFAHADTVWTTILGTNETDPDVIYDTYTTSTFDEYQQACDELLKIVEEKSCT